MNALTREWMVIIATGGLLACWILLPLIPAVLIYKLFPNTKITVTGPFAGLTINAGGAFAGYLVIFAACYLAIVPSTRDMIAGWQYEFWTLKADVKFVHDNDMPYPYSEALFSKLSVKPRTSLFEGSQATIKIDARDEDLPTVILELPDFDPKVIHLSTMTDKISIDHLRRVITLKEPIVIRETPSGGATRPTIAVQVRDSHLSTEITDPGR